MSLLSLAIIYREPGALTPDINNARTHSKRQIDQIAASIQEFGFTNPILVDEDGLLIAGHGRLRAARQLKMEKVPTIVLPHLTAIQKRALRLADNKLALTGAGWDNGLLKMELEALSAAALSFDIEVIGFSTGEIDVILSGEKHADPDDEAIPAAPSKAQTKLGDIWILDGHRIGCGDSRDPAFVERVMGGVQADAAFLDAPYNVRIQGHANQKSRHREFAMASGEMTPEAFTQFLSQTLGACVAVSRDGAVHFLCIDWRHIDELRAAARPIYGELLNMCVWNKSNAGLGSLYRSKHELVFVYRVGTSQHFNAVELGRHGRNRTTIWDYPSVNTFGGSRAKDLELHPTVKPTQMVADAIKDVTKRGEVILDTFLGSGTTLIAAERTGRRCRGIDIDPAYVDIAIERWAALTGQQPRRERRSPLKKGS